MLAELEVSWLGGPAGPVVVALADGEALSLGDADADPDGVVEGRGLLLADGEPVGVGEVLPLPVPCELLASGDGSADSVGVGDGASDVSPGPG